MAQACCALELERMPKERAWESAAHPWIVSRLLLWTAEFLSAAQEVAAFGPQSDGARRILQSTRRKNTQQTGGKFLSAKTLERLSDCSSKRPLATA